MARRGELRRAGFSLVMTVAFAVAAATAMVAVTAFGCMALFFYMETVTSPALAALCVAGFGFVFTLFMGLLVYLLPKPSLMALVLPSEGDILGRLNDAVQIGRNLGEEGRRALRANLSNATLGAVGAGILLGFSPRLRRALFAFLRRG